MFELPLDPPEVKAFTGNVVFACFLNDATVEVRASVQNDEIDFDNIEVWYCDTEVSAVLHESQLDSIQAQFDADRHNIVMFDRED